MRAAGTITPGVNGTVSITLDGVDFAGLDPYVNGGVWGHGNEGTRNIATAP